MEIWEEPIRGGYPPPWVALFDCDDWMERWGRYAPRTPMSHLTGAWATEVNQRGVRAVMPATRWLHSSQGRISPGVMAIVADMALGGAVRPWLPRGGGFTTAELSLTRVREPVLGGELAVHGRVVHHDDALGLTEAQIFDAAGELVATGSSRLSIFPPPAELPEAPDDPPVHEEPVYDTPDPWQREPAGGVLEPSVWESRTGLEVLCAQVEGDVALPPIGQLTGMRVAAAETGSATVVLPATPWLTAAGAAVGGGFTAMVADAALACAVQSVSERGDGFVPVDLKVNFLRPAFADGELLTATGRVTHKGRSIAIAHAEVANAEGKRVALATGSAALAASR